MKKVVHWSTITASCDTTKHIIHKFMRKGFQSLSAEELAVTMIQPQFTIDFNHNTGENWVKTYQFKVIERLNKCNFNIKWKTRSSVTTSGQGEEGLFFDLCKAGSTHIEQLVQFLRDKKDSNILEATDENHGRTGLHFAVEAGSWEIVHNLLLRGAKVDARDKLLRTPLHFACLGGHSTISSLLLEYNADPFERDAAGRTSLHCAVCTGSIVSALEIMAILTKSSSDLVHMKDHSGRTPLHYSVFNAQKDCNKIIQKLLQFGADINCVDQNRNTPLHFAAQSGKGKLCQLFVQNGASNGIQNTNKKTPMDVATSDYVREIMIVSNPQTQFKVAEKDLEEFGGLEVHGHKAEVRPVLGLKETDYYDFYEHA